VFASLAFVAVWAMQGSGAPDFVAASVYTFIGLIVLWSLLRIAVPVGLLVFLMFFFPKI